MNTVENLPYYDDFDGKKSTYEEYMQTVVSGQKTQRYERLMSPGGSKKQTSTLDRKDIVSRSSIKSPQLSRNSIR